MLSAFRLTRQPLEYCSQGIPRVTVLILSNDDFSEISEKLYKYEDETSTNKQSALPLQVSPQFFYSLPKASMFGLLAVAVAALSAAQVVSAERHTVTFDNRCGFGTPTLIQGGNVLSTGGAYTVNGPLTAAIAYLQTGSCGFNGDGCTLVEVTLINPTSPGSGSSADISLIPPHTFSVTSGFGYYNGCDGTGTDCTSASCPMAFRKPEDTWAQVACQANDVNIAITFCL
ncbi:hypothetical protein D9756_005602 [Leucocoprinus leucothites]|uniref:Glycopeptide n=1 Tax=Leucocoprinus leucothites TaxID=201217 RepID=A0A8H5D7K6_9AGAR|nr:hypothetical protein D9756_005602 [Leucoagaricus leucothites]